MELAPVVEFLAVAGRAEHVPAEQGRVELDQVEPVQVMEFLAAVDRAELVPAMADPETDDQAERDRETVVPVEFVRAMGVPEMVDQGTAVQVGFVQVMGGPATDVRGMVALGLEIVLGIDQALVVGREQTDLVMVAHHTVAQGMADRVMEAVLSLEDGRVRARAVEAGDVLVGEVLALMRDPRGIATATTAEAIGVGEIPAMAGVGIGLAMA